MLQRVLERHRALSCRHNHEEMVLLYALGDVRHLVPVGHLGERAAHGGVVVAYVVGYERQRVAASVKLRVALHVACQAREALQPAVEARLELRTRRHSHLYAAYRGQRLIEASHYYLRVEAVEEALVERSPELLRHLRVHVHADDDVRCAELLEGVSYAVGDVRRNAHLRLHCHICRRAVLRHALQQLAAFLHVALHVVVVIHHVQTHELRGVLRVAHEHREVDEALRILGVFQRYEYLLLSRGRLVVARHLAVAQRDLLRRTLCHHRRDDARNENHEHHAVQHVVGDERLARLQLHAHTNHEHGDGAGGVCRSESEHHVARRLRQSEHGGCGVCGYRLAERSEARNDEHRYDDGAALEEQSHVDEHAHADEEVGYEERVADELDAVHKRRHVGYVAVEDDAGYEGADDAFKTYDFARRRTHEEHRHHEDELHDGVAVTAQEPAREARNEQEHRDAVAHELAHEQQPEPHARLAAVRGDDGCKRHERHEQRNHRRTDRERHARLALQTVAAHDGVGDERVRRHEAAQEQRREHGVMQQGYAGEVCQHERQRERQQTESEEAALVALHALHVHLQRGEKHDVVESDLAEQLERVVARKDVEAVLADCYSGEHHANDMRDAQLAHDDWGKQNDEHHHKEYQGGVGYREIAGKIGHVLIVFLPAKINKKSLTAQSVLIKKTPHAQRIRSFFMC